MSCDVLARFFFLTYTVGTFVACERVTKKPTDGVW